MHVYVCPMPDVYMYTYVPCLMYVCITVWLSSPYFLSTTIIVRRGGQEVGDESRVYTLCTGVYTN